MVGILSGTAVAATAPAPATLRVYFQDESGAIRQGFYPSSGPQGWSVTGPLFTAKLYTPLAAISWADQIRVYSLTDQNTLQEYCNTPSGPWTPGQLNNAKFPALAISTLSAVVWGSGSVSIRLYCQDPSGVIQEYCYGPGWTKGSTLPQALLGSSIAAAKWTDPNIHLRVYYQDPTHSLREHAWDGSWYVGGFNPGKAPSHTPITALGWFDGQIKLRVYWEDIQRNLLETDWLGGWTSVKKAVGPLVGTEVSAVEWNNGSSIRIYDEGSNDDIVEQCTDNNESSWYVGQGVAATSGGNVVPK